MIRNLGICALLGAVITSNAGIVWNRGALHGPVNGPAAPIPAYYPTSAQPQRTYPPGTAFLPAPEETTSKAFRDVNEPIAKLDHDHQTFFDCTLTKVSDREGFVKVSNGLIRIKLEELPEPLRSKYYDPEIEKRQNEAKAEAERQQRQASFVSAALTRELWKGSHMRYVGTELKNIDSWPQVQGSAARLLQDGSLLVTTEVVTQKTIPVRVPSRVNAWQSHGAFVGGSGDGGGGFYHEDVTNSGPQVILVNYPNAKTTPTGTRIDCVADKAGVRTTGSDILQVYDYGKPYSPKSAEELAQLQRAK
jgi:hypothetical protein